MRMIAFNHSRRFFFISLFILFIYSDFCLSYHFFSKEPRRFAYPTETSFMAKMSNGAAAFYVRNLLRKFLVITAVHAAWEDPVGWCKIKNLLTDEKTGDKFYCKQIIAQSADILLFEAEWEVRSRSLDESSTLKLAGFPLASNTPIKLVGYPADPWAKGVLTVSDNCRVLSTQTAWSPFKKYHTAGHNCSVYGGNSGGPILIKGKSSQDIVMGLPASYRRFGDPINTIPDYGEKNPYAYEMEEAIFSPIVNFVYTHWSTLKKWGVEISLSAPEVDTNTQVIPYPGLSISFGKETGAFKSKEDSASYQFSAPRKLKVKLCTNDVISRFSIWGPDQRNKLHTYYNGGRPKEVELPEGTYLIKLEANQIGTYEVYFSQPERVK